MVQKIIPRVKWKSVLFLPVFLFAFIPVMPAEKNIRTVAVFFSMNPNLPVFHNFMEGLRLKLSENKDEQCMFLTEYLDLSRSTSDDCIRHIDPFLIVLIYIFVEHET